MPTLDHDSIHCLLSDIPYGINLDEWDVLHPNTNSALLGQSPAQEGKSGFKRRGKPLRGWSEADRQIPKQYQEWCEQWGSAAYPKLKDGGNVLIFCARRTMHRAIIALEDVGFVVKDILVWEKSVAHHRAQRISGVLRSRGNEQAADEWEGWRLGNLAPLWEPIVWLFKPYKHTITDNVLTHGLGAINIEASKIDDKSPTNLLRFSFHEHETRYHEAQKPLALIEFLLKLVTREGQRVLDPFLGSGTTAVACQNLNREFIGIELNPVYGEIALSRLGQKGAISEPQPTASPTQYRLGFESSPD
jgi:site-specific DNA-methyltransferase (adenine-specific)